MKKVLALLLFVSCGFLQAGKKSKKPVKSVPTEVAKHITHHVKKVHKQPVQKEAPKKVVPVVNNEFDPEALDNVLADNPDVLETKKIDPTFMQRYFTQPMGRFGTATYAALPERVQLALLAMYLYAEETYENFADFVQEKYRSMRGLDDEDDQEEENQDEDTSQDSDTVDSEQDA